MIQATPAEIFSTQYSHCTSGKPLVLILVCVQVVIIWLVKFRNHFYAETEEYLSTLDPRQTSLAKKRNLSRFYSTSSKSINPWEINYKDLTKIIPKWRRLQTLTSHLSTGIGWDWIVIICLSFSLPRKYNFPSPVDLMVNVNLMTAIEPRNWSKNTSSFLQWSYCVSNLKTVTNMDSDTHFIDYWYRSRNKKDDVILLVHN